MCLGFILSSLANFGYRTFQILGFIKPRSQECKQMTIHVYLNVLTWQTRTYSNEEICLT